MFLPTPRLLLRPPWPEDAPAIAAAMEWDIARMTSSIPWPYTLEDAREWVARPNVPPAPILDARAMIVARGAPHVPLGAMVFGHNALTGALEIGYWLARAAWGQGYATEASRAWIALAFGVLRRPELIAGHYLDNPASGTVLLKLGFRLTGRIFEYPCRARGGPAPSPEYRLTREQWLAAR